MLEKWNKEFLNTKREIEAQMTVKRWDFQSTKDIFNTPKYMIKILENLAEAHVII